MIKLNKQKVPVKYLINFQKYNNSSIEGLLYEIVNFLDENERKDGEINYWEISNKTSYRVNENLEDDIKELIEKGYLTQGKYTKYIVINHPWN